MKKDKDSEKPALLIIDMVKDNFDEEKLLPITAFFMSFMSFMVKRYLFPVYPGQVFL